MRFIELSAKRIFIVILCRDAMHCVSTINDYTISFLYRIRLGASSPRRIFLFSSYSE